MRIHGEDERRALCARGGELFDHARQHLLRLSRPERPVDKVILHIHDNNCFAHRVFLLYSPNRSACVPVAAADSISRWFV